MGGHAACTFILARDSIEAANRFLSYVLFDYRCAWYLLSVDVDPVDVGLESGCT